MTAKQFLSKGRWLDREINSLIKTRDETKDKLTRITQNYDGDVAQSSKDPHKFDKLVELEDQIDRMIDELIAQKMILLNAIEKLEDGRERMILKIYYVDISKKADLNDPYYTKPISWEQVAVSCNLSWRHIMRLRKSAYKHIEEIIS